MKHHHLPDMDEQKKPQDSPISRAKKFVTIFLWVSLFASICYAIYRIIITPPDAVPPDTPRTQADYILMLLSCVGGMAVMGLPLLLEKRWKIIVSDGLTIAYFILLYAGTVLGEVRNFFFVVPHWDLILHTFSGGLLAVLGVKLVAILNDAPRLQLKLSPFFVSFFGFCFALTMGTIWEIYEFTVDTIFGMNMQKYLTVTGEPLIGQAALQDTMTDIVVDFIGALIVSVLANRSLKKKHKKYAGEHADEAAPIEYNEGANQTENSGFKADL